MKSLVLVFVLPLASCSLTYDPDVGPLHAIVPDAGVEQDATVAPLIGCNSDSDPAVDVSFSKDVRPLMLRSPGGCSPCHLGRVTSGLDLSSYESMRRGGLNSGTRVIIPGEPCNSIIPRKISRTPPFGSRMPYNGPPYFSLAEQQVVRDWIAEGARNN